MNTTEVSALPLWPEFGSLGDPSVSRIPVSRIESWKEFPQLVEDGFFNENGVEQVFRGQRRYDWGLSPSLARLDKDHIIRAETAKRQIRLFRQAVRGRLADMSLVLDDESDELWSVGQHHGLFTPVLDWTASPYVALFFAFEGLDQDDEEENPYRAIYVINKTYLAEKTEGAGEGTPIRIYEPRKDDYGRLVNQAGLFTVSNYDNTFENLFLTSLGEDVLNEVAGEDETVTIARHICKILIPNEDRAGCLRALARMNVHHASLFPDLMGSAQYCNYRVSAWRSEEDAKSVGAPPGATSGTASSTAPPHIATTTTPAVSGATLRSILESAAPEDILSSQGAVDKIAQMVADTVESLKSPDWDVRENIQAHMRNAIRAMLKELDFEPQSIDRLAAEIVEVSRREAKDEDH